MLHDELDQIVAELVAPVKRAHPAWARFTHPGFVSAETEPMRAASRMARRLLSRQALTPVVSAAAWTEMIVRLDAVGRAFAHACHPAPPPEWTAVLHIVRRAPDDVRAAFGREQFEWLHGEGPLYDRFEQYVSAMQALHLSPHWTFMTAWPFLLFPHREFPLLPAVARWFLMLFGQAHLLQAQPDEAAYAALRKNAHAVRAGLAFANPRDLLDVYGVLQVAYSEHASTEPGK